MIAGGGDGGETERAAVGRTVSSDSALNPVWRHAETIRVTPVLKLRQLSTVGLLQLVLSNFSI